MLYNYSEFIEKDLRDGERSELVAGGLIRSLGGRVAAKAVREGKDRIKGDESILGDGDFVKEVLESCPAAVGAALPVSGPRL
jgi:putative transposase